MVKANVHLRTGNIRAALPAIRQAMKEQVLSARDALQLAQVVGMEDPVLARELWRQAKAVGIPDDLAPNALDQAFRLNVEHEADQLFGAVQTLAQHGTHPVRSMSMDDIVAFIQRGQDDAAR